MGRAAASRAEGDTDALEELRFHWGDAYRIAADGGVFTATRRDGRAGHRIRVPGLRPADGRVRRAALLSGPSRQGSGGHAMRFRDEKPGDLDRARAAVTAWRQQNPSGTAAQLIAAVGPAFHPEWAVVRSAPPKAPARPAASTGISPGHSTPDG